MIDFLSRYGYDVFGLHSFCVQEAARRAALSQFLRDFCADQIQNKIGGENDLAKKILLFLSADQRYLYLLWLSCCHYPLHFQGEFYSSCIRARRYSTVHSFIKFWFTKIPGKCGTADDTVEETGRNVVY